MKSFSINYFKKVKTVYAKIENSKYRPAIKYLVIASKIHDEMDNTVGENAFSYVTFCRWVNRFKRGRTSVEDADRSGRPKTVSTQIIHGSTEMEGIPKYRELKFELFPHASYSPDFAPSDYFLFSILKNISTQQ